MNKQDKKILKVLGMSILSVGVIFLFSSGIYLSVNDIGGDLGIWLSLIASPLISQSISIPIKYLFYSKNKKIEKKINHSVIGNEQKKDIENIILSNKVESVKLKEIRKRLKNE